jgi:hypothetical protein
VVCHCPHTTHKTHNPLVLSYNYPYFPPSLFLSTFPTQGMYPFTDLNPSFISFIYQGLFGTGDPKYLSWELKGIHCQENYHQPTSNNCCYNETHTRVHSSGLETWFFSLQIQLRSNMLHISLEFTLYGFCSSNLSFFISTFSSCTKLDCLKLLSQPLQISSLWFAFLDSHTSPIPHVPNNYGMRPLTPTLLHVFNYWLWEHSIKN